MSGVKDHHHPDHHPDELWSTHDNTSNDQPGLRTNLVTHVFLEVVGQVLRKRDFIHRANPISVVLTSQRFAQIFSRSAVWTFD